MNDEWQYAGENIDATYDATELDTYYCVFRRVQISETNALGLAMLSDIPTKTSQLQNDSGFLTQHQSLTGYYTKTQTDGMVSAVSSSV